MKNEFKEKHKKEIEEINNQFEELIKDDEIKEILDKLSNRKQETLIQGIRECQLKDIEHPFITKEEYIDKVLDHITTLQERINNQEFLLKEQGKELKELYARIDKAIEIYENSTSIKYKKKRFMEDKTTADLMYESLQGDDNV